MTHLDQLWDHLSPHILRTQVTAQDIDGLNHTNNAVYVQWCEQSAWSHSSALGLDLQRYRELDRAMAVTHSEYNYLAASREGEQIAVGTWIVDWDRKLSMTRHFQVIRVDDGITLLRGIVRFVCIELSTGRPRRLPKEFITGYGSVLLSKNSQMAGG
jgi:acyl-CoA thioester hydrolase